MIYSKNNLPIKCIMKNSTCYKRTSTFSPKGILWHSTGANNPKLSRYVQPYETDSNYNEMISLLGKNKYGNDWNHITRDAGLNAWIGKLADGTITSIQTLEWNQRPWGCGSGSKGSCNYTHLQFEICEDGLNDKKYFEKAYKEACELTAYLCDMFNINPLGTFVYNGVKVPTILCHQDAYKLGLGSNHSDIYHWFNKYGKDMDDVRNDVAALMNVKTNTTTTTKPSTNTTASVPTPVKDAINNLVKCGVINTSSYWFNNYSKVNYLDELIIKTSKSVQSKNVMSFGNVKDAINHLVKCGVINTPDYWVKNYSKIKYLDELIIKIANHIPSKFTPYMIKITASALNIRKGAGANYSIVGTIKKSDNGAYTIVDEVNGWGLLKSYSDKRNGWVSLKYCKKI